MSETFRTDHILTELGFAMKRVDDGLEGRATIIPEMCVPGTRHLRTSVLAMWTDVLSGLLAAVTMGPRVPVTLELDVHLLGSAPGSGALRCVGQTLKSGRTVFMASVEFVSGEGEAIAVGSASFMAAHDPALSLPGTLSLDGPPPEQRLSVPLAERAGCERRSPGVAVLEHSDDKLNSSNTLNGGLLALVAEEAALSLSPGATLSSLSLKYVSPVRVGPAVATARTRSGVSQVEVRDSGNNNRLAVVVTARLFP